MRLHMTPPFLGQAAILGPAPWFKLVRNSLRMGPSEGEVANLQNQQWRIEGRHFTTFHADPGSTLHFESAAGPASTLRGPFDDLQMRDGVLYGDGKLLARFDEGRQMWLSPDDRAEWPIMVVSSNEPLN